MHLSTIHMEEVTYSLWIGTEIGDFEHRNGRYFALYYYFTEFGSFRGQLRHNG